MNLKAGFRILATLAVAFEGIVSGSYAGPITVPVGLAPGSEYRLVFVTVDTYTPSDSNIADYNTEVAAEADSVPALAALDTTWSVIGSTATVNAIDNIGQDPGVPIFDLLGEMIADDATRNSGGLFSGSLIFPISYGELGNGNVDGGAEAVFTGTLLDGDANAVLTLGSPNVSTGDYAASNGLWLDDSYYDPNADSYSLYAISGVLTVVSSTPEPTTTATTLSGTAFLCLAARRRHRRRLATRTTW